MHEPLAQRFQQQLPACGPNDQKYVPALVDSILKAARQTLASDVHLCPTEGTLEMKWRTDGVLQQFEDRGFTFTAGKDASA